MAQQTWAPLLELAENHFLRLFMQGLNSLIRDEFAACRTFLERGIALNSLLPEMNDDMRLVLENLPASPEARDGAAETSETEMLLRSFTGNTTQH